VTELERCKVWIESALEYSGNTHIYEDIVTAVIEGKMQLWPAENSCWVTEITVYPRKKVLHVFLAGGNLDEILDMHDSVVQWAKEQGCEGMTLTGRKGWVKALQHNGWKPQQLMLLEKRF
tara:strand:+ start:56 stop:415 length:360 start_codon:yes stop_codon:yes gene_type:complete